MADTVRAFLNLPTELAPPIDSKQGRLCDSLMSTSIKGLVMANEKRMIIALTVLFAVLLFAGCGSPVAQLHKAIRSGNIEEAEALLAQEPNLVDATKDGQTPLLEALHENQKHIVSLLLDRGADVNVKDKLGVTALHYAAKQGHAYIAELLLAEGANVDAADWTGETPLHAAVSGGQKDVVVLLLAEGADVNAENEKGGTALHIAARAAYSEVAEILVAHGADVNARDKGAGRTALHYAAQQGHKEVVELLLAKGADVNALDKVMSRTPLYWANIGAYRDGARKDVVELLREHGGH